ncbi:MAG: EMC3/TMCO1 family protein, partial [Promethearchaeota archaeon]
MSNVAIILQILFITIGMLIFGMLLNRLLGLKREKMQEFKERASNLQERLRNAQTLGDIQLVAQVQRETMQFTRQIMLKQFIPLCLRCFIFIGIFAILGYIYADYSSGLLPFSLFIIGSGWVALYFIFSISLS